MSDTTTSSSFKKRAVIAILLLISCLASVYLLWTTDPQPVHRLKSTSQLDSLITDTFHEFNYSNSQVRTQDIRIDSSFTRKRYILEVPPTFSKTSFHYKLHERIWPYRAKTIGNVYFPDEDLQIHIAYNNTIQRTIFLYSDVED